uniref:Solute carrier family 30 member 1b n=1 Tax=Electrophorus electricus TaxID=8005 RepID=A0A4W4E2Z9_ELEEL
RPCGQNGRLLWMLFLTFGFFIVEVVVSRMTASLTMLSDSFHMLSDVISLVVALVAVHFAEKTQGTSKNTFGWIRAEVMGALVNAVFLITLCFTILLEAIGRYTKPHEIENPQIVIWVGLIGLLVNLFGLFLFHGHAGASEHGHCHGTNPRNYEKSDKLSKKETQEETSSLMENNSVFVIVNGGIYLYFKNMFILRHRLDDQMNDDTSLELELRSESSSQLNMRGVFLHVLGDALGSIIVVVNALIFTFVWKPCDGKEICMNPCHGSDHRLIRLDMVGMASNGIGAASVAAPCWVLYLDPTLCIMMVVILFYTTFPLLKESALILLQTVPKQINMQQLDGKLRSLEGVLAIHELHIWQLAGSRIIATAHVQCHDPASYMDVAKRIKNFFHDEGIHATTVQPEFSSDTTGPCVFGCDLPCYSQCAAKLCCDASWKSESEALVCTADSSGKTTPQRHTADWDISQELVLQTEMESTV